MLKIKNLMRRVIKFLIIIVVFVILVFVALSFFTAGDRKIAKEFIISCCGSKTNEFVWYELLHDGLKKEVDKDKFAEMFAASQSYETVSFSSVSKSGSSASFDGTAKTEADCASKVAVEVLEGKIIAFNINPLCPK